MARDRRGIAAEFVRGARRHGRALLLAGGAVLAAVLSLEIAAVIFLPRPPIARAPFVKTQRHPSLGYMLTPGQKTFTYSKPVTTNSDGLRDDRALDRAVLNDARVILCLGGSETFGKGVAYRDTFPKILEARLNERVADSPFVVINAGVPDYRLDQSLRFLDERGQAFSPDVVILSFYWDDLFPALSDLDLAPERGREWLPRRWASRSGMKETLGTIYTRSRVLCFTRNQLKTWIGRWRGHDLIRWRDATLEGRPLPALDRAWDRAGGLLGEFSRLAVQRRFRPVVLILPIEHQLSGRYPHARFQAEVRERSAAVGLATIDTLPELERSYEGWSSLFLPYDGRPNARAHEIIAGVLLARLDPETPK